jgi:membrane-bound lytic murein transglycosylase MltF
MTRRGFAPAVALALLVTAVACSGSKPSSAPAGSTAAPAAPPAAAPAPAAAASQAPPAQPETAFSEAPSPYEALPAETRQILDRTFTGDFDEMVKRRLIRVGVVFNRTQYFIDHGEQRGMIYESVRLFEEEVNKRLHTGQLKVLLAFVPLSREQLLPALVNGKVDAVAAVLTATPERQKIVAFSNPTRSDVSEVVVTAPDVPPVHTTDDLAGRTVFVRKSSAYFEALTSLNASFAQRGKPPVVIKLAPEALEDDDILEMVNAGLVEATVVNDFVATFWRQIFTNVHVNVGATLSKGAFIGVAVRKDSPKLLKAINIWIKEYGPRTTFGNMMSRRYLSKAGYVSNPDERARRERFLRLATLFKKYGDQYNVDYILMAAQGYQESRLDQSVKSRVGAIGIMQVMPATGKDLNVGDISQEDANIHAGVKYIQQMRDRLYGNDPMDPTNKLLMTLASYNAGPAKIAKLRKEAAQRGLDPNKWFGNVERIVSERIGRETVQYVSNIYKYYVAYQLALDRRSERERARAAVKAGR